MKERSTQRCMLMIDFIHPVGTLQWWNSLPEYSNRKPSECGTFRFEKLAETPNMCIVINITKEVYGDEFSFSVKTYECIGEW